MNYLEIMKKLCQENEGYIILMRNGVFYTAIGKGAIKLSELFGLKLLCISKELCKCSVPANAIEKYIVKFQKSNYSYMIFDYKKEGFEDNGEKYRLITQIDGNLNEEQRSYINCLTCEYNKEKQIRILNKTINELDKMIEEVNRKDEG